MAQGAGAYNKLTKLDNPVIDSVRYWGSAIGKQNDALVKENQERKESMAKQYREWSKANGVTDEMFQSMITENANYDDISYNAANQARDLYLKVYREGIDNYWDMSKRAKSESQMKTILSSFKSLNDVTKVVAEKMKTAPDLLKNPLYDRDLNGDFEDIAAAVIDNKNFQVGMNKDNYQFEVWYPSSDGSIKKMTIPAITSGHVLDPIMRTDGNQLSKSIIDTVAHKLDTSLDGLMEISEDKWYAEAQKYYEEAFKSELDDRKMASLYKDNINRESRKKAGFTDAEREEVWNVFKDRGDVFFKEAYSKKYNKEAVSMRNTDENNKEKRHATDTRAKTEADKLGLGWAKFRISQEEMDLKKQVFQSKNKTSLVPMITTEDRGATKKGTHFVNIGLEKGIKIPTNKTYTTQTNSGGTMVNGKLVGGTIKRDTKKYGTVEVRGFNAVKQPDGTWKFAAEHNNSTIPYNNPAAIATAAGYNSADDMFRALNAANAEAAKSKK